MLMYDFPTYYPRQNALEEELSFNGLIFEFKKIKARRDKR